MGAYPLEHLNFPDSPTFASGISSLSNYSANLLSQQFDGLNPVSLWVSGDIKYQPGRNAAGIGPLVGWAYTEIEG